MLRHNRRKGQESMGELHELKCYVMQVSLACTACEVDRIVFLNPCLTRTPRCTWDCVHLSSLPGSCCEFLLLIRESVPAAWRVFSPVDHCPRCCYSQLNDRSLSLPRSTRRTKLVLPLEHLLPNLMINPDLPHLQVRIDPRQLDIQRTQMPTSTLVPRPTRNGRSDTSLGASSR